MGYSDKFVQQVWEKAHPIREMNPDLWRMDPCGAWIKRTDYGKTMSDFGWRIDSTEDRGWKVEKLKPLHVQNEVDKNRGDVITKVTSEGRYNVQANERPEKRWNRWESRRPAGD